LDLKRAEAATEKILQEGRAIVEMSLVTKDGRLIPTEYTGSLIRDAEGRPQYVIAVGRDITERKRAEEVLQESEERYRVSLESAPYGIVVHDQDEKTLIFNPQLEKITGYSKEEIPDVQTWLEKVYLEEEYRRLVIEERRAIALEEHPRIREAVITRKDGEKRICQFVSSLLPSGIRTIFINDITRRKQAEEALQESEQKYRTVVEDMPALVCRFLPDGVLTFVNEHYCQYFNKRREELEGHNFFQFIPRQERRKVQQHYASLIPENPVITYEHKVSAPDGTVRWQRWTDRALFDKRGRPLEYQSIGEDITERKQAEEQLAHMATHDPLTGLPNRILFNDRLTLALAHARRNQQTLAVMLLDLDHFKGVNDTLGHSVGDQLLQVIGYRLASLLRKSDTIARMGGDEFMMLLPETAQEEDVAKIAEKILEAFREPFEFDDHILHITTSIGVAICPYDGEDADVLMRNADIAMYRAKEEGRDNYQRCTPSMRARALE
jgi:diguanylate cyclase (GGDEF)-like protein/PAS domain S-box-containing protein